MQTIDIKEVKQEVVDKMEQYKQEFMSLWLRVMCSNWRVYIKEWTQIPIFYECRSLCDRFTVNASW